jgi:hypothetical protein
MGALSSHGLGRERETGNVEHGTGNGERGTGNGETGVIYIEAHEEF